MAGSQCRLPAYFSRWRCSAFVVGRAILPAAAFQAAFWGRDRAFGGKGRLKAGCSQDWLPHNLGRMVSRIKKYAALGKSAWATSPTKKNGEPEGSPLAISKGRKRSTLELKLQGELNVTATRSVRRNGRCGGDIGIGALDIKIRVVEHVVHLTA